MADKQTQPGIKRMEMPEHINEVLKTLKERYNTTRMRDALEQFINEHDRSLLEQGYDIVETRGRPVKRLPPPEKSK